MKTIVGGIISAGILLARGVRADAIVVEKPYNENIVRPARHIGA